jgi:hypothetical protein
MSTISALCCGRRKWQVEKYKKEYKDLRERLQRYLDAKDAEAAAKQPAR